MPKSTSATPATTTDLPRQFHQQVTDMLAEVKPKVGRSIIKSSSSKKTSAVREGIAAIEADLASLEGLLAEYERTRPPFQDPTVERNLAKAQQQDRDYRAKTEAAQKTLDMLESNIQVLQSEIARLEASENPVAAKSASAAKLEELKVQITAKKTQKNDLKDKKQRAAVRDEIKALNIQVKALKKEKIPTKVAASADSVAALARLRADLHAAEQKLRTHQSAIVEPLKRLGEKIPQTKANIEDAINRARLMHSYRVSNPIMFLCLRLYVRVIDLQKRLSERATDKWQALAKLVGATKSGSQEKPGLDAALTNLRCPDSDNKTGTRLYASIDNLGKARLLTMESATPDFIAEIVPTQVHAADDAVLSAVPDRLGGAGRAMSARALRTAIDLTGVTPVATEPSGSSSRSTSDSRIARQSTSVHANTTDNLFPGSAKAVTAATATTAPELRRSISVDSADSVSPGSSPIPSPCSSAASLRESAPAAAAFLRRAPVAPSLYVPADSSRWQEHASRSDADSAARDEQSQSEQTDALVAVADDEPEVCAIPGSVRGLRLGYATIDACLENFLKGNARSQFTEGNKVSAELNRDFYALELLYAQHLLRTKTDVKELQALAAEYRLEDRAEDAMERAPAGGCCGLFVSSEFSKLKKARFGLRSENLDELRQSSFAILTARYQSKPMLDQLAVNSDSHAASAETLLLHLRMYELLSSMVGTREHNLQKQSTQTPRQDAVREALNNCTQNLHRLLEKEHCGNVSFKNAHETYLSLPPAEKTAFLEFRQTRNTVATLMAPSAHSPMKTPRSARGTSSAPSTPTDGPKHSPVSKM